MSLQATLAVGAGAAGYLKYVGKVPASFADIAREGGDVKAASYAVVASASILGANFVEYLFYGPNGNGPIARCSDFIRTCLGQEKSRKIVVKDWIEEYNQLHKAEDASVRNSAYASLVNHYYELATLFYEVGWCQSFHFAYHMVGESFAEGIRRHEYYLASFLGGLKPGSKIIDVGCGIGGPYRNISRFTGWDITGVTLNEYQVKRANHLCKINGLEKQARSVQGDFMKLSSIFPKESFDGAYAIEATCHAPERRGVYGEIFKVLKPGAYFATYEWCLTDLYDKSNPKHRLMKKQVEEGDGLPDICHTSEVNLALKDCGFEVITYRDMALDPHQAKVWYLPMMPSLNPFTQRFQFNPLGMFVTKWGLRLLEFLFIVPHGTSKVQVMLQQAALGLADGGKEGTFTPMYLIVARKPGGKK
jgi:sterol 24-C-methyltransferase